MLIESKIRRRLGTVVTLDETPYAFQPSKDHGGAHVCDVTKPEHIDRFLSVTEGFRVYVEGRKPDTDDSDDETDADANQTDTDAEPKKPGRRRVRALKDE